MQVRLWHALLPITLIAVLSACTAGNEAADEDPATAPHDVRLSITGHTLDAPDTIDAGWITFRFANHGDDIHYAHIVQLDAERTVPELVSAYAEAIRTSAARPKWVKRFGGPGGTAPGDSAAVTQYLEPGSYVWICPVEDDAGNPHFGKGEFKAFVVRAATSNQAAAPAARTEIRLTDYAFVPQPPLQAGRYTVRVVNAGSEPHDVGLMRLAPGKTVEDLRSLLNPERARRADQEQGEPEPLENLGTPVGGVAVIAPGMQAFFDADLAPGEYVLFCMVTASDGRSHIEHGMIQQITVD